MESTDASFRPVVSGGNSSDKESHVTSSGHRSGRKRGGWITLPFLIGTTALLTMAWGGLLANLTVYLIEEFNVKSIDAAQIGNVVSGCVTLFPVAGAVIADSFSVDFSLISFSSFLSLLASIIFTLTAAIDPLRPQRCDIQAAGPCQGPTKAQFALLYAGVGLLSAGIGGFRFTMATMGADQLDEPEAQAVYFNWFFFSQYAASVVSFTAIVFVQDNVSWPLGFGLCAVFNLLGSALFMSGKRFYRKFKGRSGRGSPLTGLVRVVVAAATKRHIYPSSVTQDYYYGRQASNDATPPTDTFRFLNRAAQKMEGDIKPDGSISKPWRLCTVQQVEDLKTIIKLLPLWLSGILLVTPGAILQAMTVLQALTMDRHVTPHFKVPAGSILVWVLLSCAVALPVIDRFLSPTWHNLTGRPLQRTGVGHVLTVLGMATSAIVESRRLDIYKNSGGGPVVPMNVALLFPQLILVGVGEAFHFPAQVSLYYQEFPTTLRNMAAGMVALLVGVSFYMSTAIIDVTRRVTGWLPDNINDGRLDYVYWVIAISGVLNLVYYLGSIIFTSTGTIDSLRPRRCNIQAEGPCQGPTKAQFGVLYAGVGLVSAGIGGFRFTMATMGADQLDEPEARAVYFNWSFFSQYAALVVSAAAIVFVQDNVGWALGFSLCAVFNLLGSAIFMSGKRSYRKFKGRSGRGSPLTGLVRVVVSAAAKRHIYPSSGTQDYYCGRQASNSAPPTNTFSGILLVTPVAILQGMTVLQALTMDRHVTPHFKIPAGSVLVWVLLSCVVALPVIDRFLSPTWHSLTGRPLQRTGVGHVFTILGMATSAIVESRRLEIYKNSGGGPTILMNVGLLFMQLIMAGFGEAFHFPAQVLLYYQEFPVTLRSMAIGMMALLIGVSFYLSTVIIDVIRKATDWLPDNINDGRLDYVYLVLTISGVLNFVYYLVCAKLYKYHQVEKNEVL